MALKLHTSEVEIYGEDNEPHAKVMVVDSLAAEVSITRCVHTAESWAELAQAVAQAIEALGLEAT